MKYKVIQANSATRLEKSLNENAAKGYTVEKYSKTLDCDSEWLYTVIMVKDNTKLSGSGLFGYGRIKQIALDFYEYRTNPKSLHILCYNDWWEKNKHKY